ncbi:helix-turn-helix transcriptional regulator [Variovorax sp. Sphag1AA]|uniref:helix-turn-helix transcriptional regulator n=1 Tax=Variovorax sp. Sphag1AA TaxID=2587027 RepID=UPI001612F8B9|nr:AraC family transcriptional regulator [Variovorax sp. Sphag1AA]MBB3178133.1 AraC-like DNA-binding protein [Variovorax sp. Sphag1AA]
MESAPRLAAPSSVWKEPAITARIIVAHSAALVGAGLAAMLRSTSHWDVCLWDDSSEQQRHPVSRHLPIIVGDAPMIGRALEKAKAARGNGGPSGPRVLLVRGEEPVADSMAEDDVDGSVSLACGADELIDAVRRLASQAPSMRAALPSDARGGLAPWVLRRVREHVWSKLAERIELRELAAIAGLSACHFSRAFRQSMGCPPHRYVMECRVEMAAAVIRQTERPFGEIALDVGFSDQSHFTRTFMQYMGETPRAFRRRHR